MVDLEQRARDALGTVPLRTNELATALLQPGEALAEVSAALERLARNGSPLAQQGPPVCRRMFGRTRFVRPWQWRIA